jgi:hypothetical protein
MSTCPDRCRHNFVTEDTEICFPPPVDASRHDSSSSRIQKLRNGREPGGQAGTGLVSNRIES